MNRILNVFRLDERNSGDWLSPPTRYFNFENSEVKYLDYVQIPGKKIKADLLIIGGGGLISAGGKKRKWAPFLDNWLNIVDAKSYILWGVGIDKEYQTEDFNKKFDLIGCRQENTIFEYVPCASCMHSIFDKYKDTSGNGEVKISHFKRLIPNSYSTNIDNFEENIFRIANSKKVITTSYHIWYWSKLLNKEVEIYESTSFRKPLHEKMYNLPLNINIEEARNNNNLFSDKVNNIWKKLKE